MQNILSVKAEVDRNSLGANFANILTEKNWTETVVGSLERLVKSLVWNLWSQLFEFGCGRDPYLFEKCVLWVCFHLFFGTCPLFFSTLHLNVIVSNLSSQIYWSCCSVSALAAPSGAFFLTYSVYPLLYFCS